MNRKRIWITGAGVLFVVSLWLLAGSVSQFEFQDGYFFYRSPGEDEAASQGSGVMAKTPVSDWVRVTLFILVWVLFPASILMMIFNPRSLKTILMRTAMIVSWVLFAIVISQAMERMGFLSNFGASGAGAGAIAGGNLEAFPDPSSVVMPWWTQWLSSLFVLSVGLWLIWRIYRAWLARRPATLEAELAEQAALAADALRSGTPLREVVLRCYQRMCGVLSSRQMRASDSLTPREFELQLKKAGIDDPNVSRLSRLFERVRYSAHRAASEDEQEALSCLEGIETRYRSQP